MSGAATLATSTSRPSSFRKPAASRDQRRLEPAHDCLRAERGEPVEPDRGGEERRGGAAQLDEHGVLLGEAEDAGEGALDDGKVTVGLARAGLLGERDRRLAVGE